MATDGQRAEGVKLLEAGLKGLHEWVDAIPGRAVDGQYWDPGRVLRGRMEETLGMLRSEKVDWSKVEQNVRWLGREFDDEIEEVRRERGSNPRDADLE
jgi:hypothetical protein